MKNFWYSKNCIVSAHVSMFQSRHLLWHLVPWISHSAQVAPILGPGTWRHVAREQAISKTWRPFLGFRDRPSPILLGHRKLSDFVCYGSTVAGLHCCCI
ncbi:hypothetical protein COCSUDRAFT_34247 [Coccomyxa subellipsoidea C-169]|uniref:Uncharacterized protein n=1 Tax=Coccomyxa subellipsoidea (strain C-169) TaxID=574566 RepID=I0YLI4_COCSC|nr:hypothetical protein COCSUDRAFT_34247 [Coccomyxa subellipsoidea C-169]EIE19253.1 hypothetical protein COCSUDRAFT_34247 [Coccomyxa subellipsoidea C-169]|eukprot:XP_005643797.1 hypothetical protein COCSUDRAFT_34247 [Coccomyxa subellipsoidea C-169]